MARKKTDGIATDTIVTTYREFPIRLTQAGEFTANVDGVDVIKPSLAALKKYIAEADKENFKPVVVLAKQSFYGGGERVKGTDLSRVKVISRRGKSGGHGRVVFVMEGGNELRYSTYHDSPESIKAAKAIHDHEAETKRILDKRDAELQALEDELKKYEIDPATHRAVPPVDKP